MSVIFDAIPAAFAAATHRQRRRRCRRALDKPAT